VKKKNHRSLTAFRGILSFLPTRLRRWIVRTLRLAVMEDSRMDGVDYFFSLAATACLLVFVYWPSAFLVTFGLGTASTLAVRGAKNEYRSPALGSLAQLVVPAAILLCGVLFRWDGPDDADPPAWPSHFIPYLLWGHVPVTAGLLVFFRRAWLLVLAAGLAVLGFSLAAVLASGMAVTGDCL
jgi:hypothetical protein